MLATDLRHDLVRTVLEPLDRTDAAWAEARYREMQREIEAILPPVGAPVTHRAADLRYLGQEHTVAVTVGDLADWPTLRGRFDEAHRRAYGYAAPDVPVQLLNLRLTVVFTLAHPRLPALPPAAGVPAPFETRKIYSMLAGGPAEYRVFERDRLRAGHRIDGPAAVEEAGTTTIIDAEDVLAVDAHGCLVIEIAATR
jgi:N-methylhydantoinase A